MPSALSSDLRLVKRRVRDARRKAQRPELTHAALLARFTYDPASGVFTRNWATATQEAGSVATFSDGQGYLAVSVDGKQYRAHRLAVFYMTGKWPERSVDHRNRDRSDNRWANLRVAGQIVNMQNCYDALTRSRSGIRGVSYCKREGKWRASIQVPRLGQVTGKGQYRSLGYFSTPEAAQRAYLDAKAKFHTGAEPELMARVAVNAASTAAQR